MLVLILLKAYLINRPLADATVMRVDPNPLPINRRLDLLIGEGLLHEPDLRLIGPNNTVQLPLKHVQPGRLEGRCQLVDVERNAFAEVAHLEGY
jgi:hypothetical protein